jgi:hypothetical protein
MRVFKGKMFEMKKQSGSSQAQLVRPTKPQNFKQPIAAGENINDDHMKPYDSPNIKPERFDEEIKARNNMMLRQND